MKKATNSQEQAKVGIEDIELRALKGESALRWKTALGLHADGVCGAYS